MRGAHRKLRIAVVALTAAVGGACVAPAQATYLGDNGKIAFARNDGSGVNHIWTINPDGSGAAPLTGGDSPAWSADGSKLAYGCPAPNATNVCTANADGSSINVIDNSNVHPQDEPTWSPDGTYLAISSGNMCGSGCWNTAIWRIDSADGADQIGLASGASDPNWGRVQDRLNGLVAFQMPFSGFAPPPPQTIPPPDLWLVDPRVPGQTTQLTDDDGSCCPDWSPDGTKIVFASYRDGNYQIYTMNAEGGMQTRITTNSDDDLYPAWSPDGTKIVFARVVGDEWDLYLMNPDGSGQTQLTNTPGITEWGPAWRPVPQLQYARPKGASPIRASLVPAYEPCAAPNREHGPPLAFGSCAPPDPRAGFMTFGSAPAGSSPKAVGHVLLKTLAGSPNSGDNADVEISVNLTDVRRGFDLADGPGSLDFPIPLRLTDKGSGAFDSEQATMQEFNYFNNPLRVLVPCAETADPTIGSTCSVTTTADALFPGTFQDPIKEGARAIWQLDQLAVYDGGEDGFIDSRDDNTVLAVQGVFVP